MYILEHFPLVFVARVGRFDGEGVAVDGEQQIDDVFERHVPVVRAGFCVITSVN